MNNPESFNWIFKTDKYSSGISIHGRKTIVIMENSKKTIIYEKQVVNGITLKEFLHNLQTTLDSIEFDKIAKEITEHIIKDVQSSKFKSINQIIVTHEKETQEDPILIYSPRLITDDNEQMILKTHTLAQSVINQLSMTSKDYSLEEQSSLEINLIIKIIEDNILKKNKETITETESEGLASKGLFLNKGFKLKTKKNQQVPEIKLGISFITSITDFTYSKLSDLSKISKISKDLNWSNLLQGSRIITKNEEEIINNDPVSKKFLDDNLEIGIKVPSNQEHIYKNKYKEKISTLVSQLKIILSSLIKKKSTEITISDILELDNQIECNETNRMIRLLKRLSIKENKLDLVNQI